MLHKPVPGSEELRVLRHTISQAIPIQDLISRYLPSSSKNSMSDDGYAQKKKEQDIPSFVRALRKELVALQRRKDALKRLVNARGVKAVKALDAEERYWKVEWQEGGFARLNVSNKGEVEEVVSVMENGSRDRKRERRLRGVGRVEGLVDAV